jgi:phospholipase C
VGQPGLTRRGLLAAAAAGLATVGLDGCGGARPAGAAGPGRAGGGPAAALRVLGRTTLRSPDSRPAPQLPVGTDTLPGIEHVVILMLENHSYDNLLGMLGRGPGERPRGDGFTLDRAGRPTAVNGYPDGRRQHAFRMPTTCQLAATPSQEWLASHHAYAGGANSGFVSAPIEPGSARTVGGVAMGYWTRAELPFTYSLADTFPLADRWFASLLGQTDPNRRYLIAATSSGMTDDITTSARLGAPDTLFTAPANGTIFDRLTAGGISWTDYNASFPAGTTAELYPLDTAAAVADHQRPTADFFADAAGGTLPAVALLDPDFRTDSQENPQDIAVGEAFLARVVQALGHGPGWRVSLLVVCYDEGGGYYDHVAPPVALAPDAVAAVVPPGVSRYDGFRRYGFRVPGLVVSPYARAGHLSHRVHDHTSVLALLERKWNLPAMTYRDANANDLTDMLDLAALAARSPVFPELPLLAGPGLDPASLACERGGAGTIPPAGSVSEG